SEVSGVPSFPNKTEVPAAVALSIFVTTPPAQNIARCPKSKRSTKNANNSWRLSPHPTVRQRILRLSVENSHAVRRTATIPSTPVNLCNQRSLSSKLPVSFRISRRTRPVTPDTCSSAYGSFEVSLFYLPYRIAQVGFCILPGENMADERRSFGLFIRKPDSAFYSGDRFRKHRFICRVQCGERLSPSHIRSTTGMELDSGVSIHRLSSLDAPCTEALHGPAQLHCVHLRNVAGLP